MNTTDHPTARLRNCTLVPTLLIREELPYLKLAETKLLLVIVDATLGWRDPKTGRRKEADWLTHSQLKARTGCASEAVSRAVDALVSRNLIEVTSDTGNLLATPQARRRCSGRLFFRLSPRVLADIYPPHTAVKPVDNSDGSGDNVAQTEMAASENGAFASVTEAAAPITENRKPKTTKESLDRKITPYGGASTPLGLKNPPTKAGTTDPGVKHFLDAYSERFRRKNPYGAVPLIHWGKDGTIAKRLLARFPFGQLVDLLDRFFTSDDPWVARRGYCLAAFEDSINQLLMDPPPSKHAPKAVESGAHGWERAGMIGQPTSETSRKIRPI